MSLFTAVIVTIQMIIMKQFSDFYPLSIFLNIKIQKTGFNFQIYEF